jgi:DNA-binding HxlR family transcriptional regulator
VLDSRWVAAVEGRSKHGRVLRWIGRTGDTCFMVTEVARHENRKAGDPAAHLMVSDRWDRELVRDQWGQTEHPDPVCPVEVAVAAISGRWTTLVLRELMHGPLSFGQLSAALPSLSDKVLSDRLHQLQAQGLLHRQSHSGFPTRTTYTLTAAGQQVRPLLIELYRTGQHLQQHLIRK